MENNKILNGPIFSSIFKFSIPILISLFIQALYSAVDLWMVSQFGSNADITGVSNGGQTIMIVHGLVIGLSVGISVLLGKTIGEKDDKKAADVLGNSIIVMSVIGIIISIVSAGLSPFITKALHVPSEAYTKTLDYIFITGIGTICVAGYNILYNIFCGLGDSKTPLLFVLIACITNFILDYIFIDIFTLGAKGAAIATILAQAISVILSLLFIKKKIPFKVTKENFKFNKKLALKILKLGAPIGLLRALSEFSFLVIIGFVNELGLIASSGVGIAEKLVMFILLIPSAYMTSISTFVAQNNGAKNIKRVKKSLYSGMIISASIGFLMAYITFFHGDLLIRLFVNDEEVIKCGALFLKATSIECLFWSIALCFDGYFSGLEHTTYVMAEGLLISLLVRVPVAYYTTQVIEPHLFKIGLSNACAAISSLVLAIGFYIYLEIKKKRKIV